jgi:hypothetical protein
VAVQFGVAAACAWGCVLGVGGCFKKGTFIISGRRWGFVFSRLRGYRLPFKRDVPGTDGLSGSRMPSTVARYSLKPSRIIGPPH